MNLEKRAFLYLTRKKGKNLLLGIVFLLISFSLLTGSSVYLGIQQISKDLRSNIGASFSIRPYEQFGIGFILICLAVIIASYTIIRLRPKDILTKME